MTPAGLLPADLMIEGRMVALAEPGAAPAGPERLAAIGCFVLPGGVDPHCHIMADMAAATTAPAQGAAGSAAAAP